MFLFLNNKKHIMNRHKKNLHPFSLQRYGFYSTRQKIPPIIAQKHQKRVFFLHTIDVMCKKE